MLDESRCKDLVILGSRTRHSDPVLQSTEWENLAYHEDALDLKEEIPLNNGAGSFARYVALFFKNMDIHRQSWINFMEIDISM